MSHSVGPIRGAQAGRGARACHDGLVARRRTLVRRLAFIGVFALAVAACGTEDSVGGEREVACGRDVRFPESFLEGPDQSRERFAATALGRVLDDFFMAGPGVEENGEDREGGGGSPGSGTTAPGTRNRAAPPLFHV